MTRARRRAVATLCVALATAGCGGSAEIAEGGPTWTLTETLRIRSSDEGPTSFSWVKGIAVDARGRIHVYEHSTQDIRVFGPDGSYLQTIGRRGAGPGELANAEGIVFASDGSLWVRDAGNSRFTVFNADGDFLTAHSSYFCWSQGVWMPRVSEGRLVDYDCRPRAGGVDYFVIAYRTAGAFGVDTLGPRAECGTRELAEAATWITPRENGMMFRQIPFAPRGVGAIGPSGETWCAPNSAEYALLRLGPAGDTLRVTRAVTALPVTQAERDSVIAGIEAQGPTGVDFSRIPATKPVIDRVSVDDEGRAWVQRSDAEGNVLLDVFGADGAFLATARLGRVATGIRMPFVVHGDDVYLTVLDENDVPQIARYRITR